VASEFQRARRPEQVAERRAEILQVARELLAEHRLAEISLRELSSQVGLAKSNVLRYFDSREGIFLELLDVEWRTWLDELEGSSEVMTLSRARHARPIAVADRLTESLAERPLLCELLSSLASVLEHNISLEYARNFKARAAENAVRLREWLRANLPNLEKATAHYLAGAVTLVAGALWSYQRPSANVALVNKEMGGLPAQPFVDNLRVGLRTYLVGASELHGLL